jgi:hypothetical protein
LPFTGRFLGFIFLQEGFVSKRYSRINETSKTHPGAKQRLFSPVSVLQYDMSIDLRSAHEHKKQEKTGKGSKETLYLTYAWGRCWTG